MNRRSRSHHRSSPNRTEPFLKFLKPGALAQIRDSRISARSHRVVSLLQIRTSPPSSPPSTPGQPPANAMDGFPCFSARIYGPRCPQRKKLVAAKSVLFPSQNPSSPVHDSPDPLIDVFSADIVAAH
ncbi:uncharacterized protein LOC107408961 [Ziziphus jujuba]|uniref:Uncharacterized protein LOC107408961 n=2 Tax=Ziziphus jujuba TaxID=326968 RepID=A0A6P3Z351_ZIZJJ|nr:uncharacterized protein LOC107408961 [Ziziphus jujuba]KAH7533064.1 hypothetical protein FEM48_Zijuj04G0090200 [Ziziphus jujuba var. spinosa]